MHKSKFSKYIKTEYQKYPECRLIFNLDDFSSLENEENDDGQNNESDDHRDDRPLRVHHAHLSLHPTRCHLEIRALKIEFKNFLIKSVSEFCKVCES